MITTDDLNLLDEVHLTPESQSKLGTRFAEAYLTFIESP
jgi:hypothetical protein